MNNKQLKDEYLEELWHLNEASRNTLDDLHINMGTDFNNDIIDQLISEDLVLFSNENKTIAFTEKGRGHARRIIRAHRIAERMMHDVMGKDDEEAACEFEHTIATELVDSICILLGHPKECPHGKPIPEGDCCKAHIKTMESSVTPLTELEIGKSARVAYVHCKGDQQLQKFDGLQIKPGSIVKLNQVYPTYVIECENVNVAIDNDLASNICLWKENESYLEALKAHGQGNGKDKKWNSGFRFGLFSKRNS